MSKALAKKKQLMLYEIFVVDPESLGTSLMIFIFYLSKVHFYSSCNVLYFSPDCGNQLE